MLKGYRTIIFNVIMLGVMIGQQAGWFGDAAPTAEDVGSWLDSMDTALAALWGGGNVALRFITNTNIGKAE